MLTSGVEGAWVAVGAVGREVEASAAVAAVEACTQQHIKQ